MWSAGRMDLAEKYFQLAEKIYPRDSQMLSEIGNFYIGRQQFDKAVSYLERSRTMTSFVPRTYEYLSYAYLYADRPADALATVLHANSMGGTHKALTFAVLGGAYDGLGRYDDAAGAWRVSAKAPSGDVWLAHAMLARSLARAGRTGQAMDAVGVAMTKTKGQPSIDRILTELKQAIEGGCYPDGDSCDPLKGWAIAGGLTVPRSAFSN
jgi:tetratricopeptide (TPR) repeat protein